MAKDALEQTSSHAAEAADKAAKSVGMPQLDFSTFPNQVFWLVVALLVIYFILSRLALPRIASVLAERQGTITNDIAAAEELKLKAIEAEDAYNKALAEARAEASRIIMETKAEIQVDLDKAIAVADAEIAARAAESEKAIAAIRKSAMDSVRDVAKDTAQEVVTALGGSADTRTISSAVTERLKG